MERTAAWPPKDDGSELEWVHLAIDVRPARFGDVLGELNRTGWTITGSEELDENRQPLGDRRIPPPGQTWQRLFAKQRLISDVRGLLG